MRVLVIGGSGLVGNIITPYLKQDHALTIFDLQAPSDPALSYIQGDIMDYESLAQAAKGHDALIYMAMGSLHWETIHGIQTAYDINVKGIHLALKAAHEASITQIVYTSSMSVYSDLMKRYFPEENLTPDAYDLYGFTKRLGEEVCLNAVLNWGLNVNVLRLCFPTPDDKMDDVEPEHQLLATAASDVAKAISAALSYQGRFQTFMISGDYQHQQLNMTKANLILGWKPLYRKENKS